MSQNMKRKGSSIDKGNGPINHSQSPPQTNVKDDNEAVTRDLEQKNKNSSCDSCSDCSSSQSVWGYLVPLKTDLPSGEIDKNSCAQHNINGGFLLGNSDECNLKIDRPGIADRHCLLIGETLTHNNTSMRCVYVEALSPTGVQVNGKQVPQYKRTQLESGVTFKLCDGVEYEWINVSKYGEESFHETYELGKKIGHGHFADVYLARCRENGRRFAVKIFSEQLDGKFNVSGQETSILMSLNHPNLVRMSELFRESDHVFLVLEYASLGELYDFIVSRKRLAESTTKLVIRQLLAGIQYLHNRNIVHRDIKPENILLFDAEKDRLDESTKESEDAVEMTKKDLGDDNKVNQMLRDGRMLVKICDFGLSDFVGESSFVTKLCGTPTYAAPEQLDACYGEAKNRSNRNTGKPVDMWSLGVLIYVCLAGFPPFTRQILERVPTIEQVRDGKYVFYSPYWDGVSEQAKHLISHLLVLDPKNRLTVDQAIAHPWFQE